MTDNDTIHAGDVTGEVERFLRYEAALRKIAGWQGYATHADRLGVEVLTEYETGANDMLVTLKQIAEEALR